MSVRIITADVMDGLAQLPDESVHCVVTSPPYYGLRNYNMDGQIGLEKTHVEYVEKLVDVFREVRRVLRSDGTCWLNLGDSYASGKGTCYNPGGNTSSFNVHLKEQNVHPLDRGNKSSLSKVGLKPKDLIGVPWSVAFALRADGWWLRQDVIWNKTNPMPESTEDRCTKAHEYLFMLTKSARYYYDQEAIKEPSVTLDPRRPYGSEGAWELDGRPVEQRPNGKLRKRTDPIGGASHKERGQHSEGGVVSEYTHRNKRSVWTITTQPFPEAHFATFPTEIPETCIKAGCPEWTCSGCGAPWCRVTEKGEPNLEHQRKCGGDASGEYHGQARKPYEDARAQNASDVKRRILEGMRETITVGFVPTCQCGNASVSGTVLDPFAGAGTTGMVADRLGRDAILIELNPEYAAMAARRIKGDCPLFAEVGA